MKAFSVLAHVAPTVLLVAYSQLAMKWRVRALGEAADTTGQRLAYVSRALVDPYVMSAILAAFLASLAWMLALSKIPLNVGFPVYYGLTFIAVMVGSALVLREPVTGARAIGASLVLLGVIVGSAR